MVLPPFYPLSITSLNLTRHIRSSCLLFEQFISLKKQEVSQLHWFSILFEYQEGRQSKKIITLLSAHVRSGQIQSQSSVKRKPCLPIHVLISVQNTAFNLIKLLLDHKLMIISWFDRQMDGNEEIPSPHFLLCMRGVTNTIHNLKGFVQSTSVLQH